jgi:hypothetical protein
MQPESKAHAMARIATVTYLVPVCWQVEIMGSCRVLALPW